MKIHYVSYRKYKPRRMGLEFAIPADSRQEARTIAEKEAAQLAGYRFLGCN